MARVRILLPDTPGGGQAARPVLASAERLTSLDGATVGIVNNGWACMNVLTTTFAGRLRQEYGVGDVDEHRMAATEWLSDSQAESLARGWDAAIVGIGH